MSIFLQFLLKLLKNDIGMYAFRLMGRRKLFLPGVGYVRRGALCEMRISLVN